MLPLSTRLPLGVLDQSPVAEGSTGADALRNTVDLARLVDGLGFHRLWVAEHHGGASLAGPAPEALVGPLAAATRHLRVGSGGVMLPHYSPFKVAEAFSLLAGLFPGRIDLGVGRAAGTDPLTTFALQRDRRQATPEDFPGQLAELLAHLEDALPADHPFAHLPATLPGRPHAPEPWLLGSSAQSALWAAELGLPYAFADFIDPRGAAVARTYRERFAPGVRLDAPRTVVAVWALAAETEEEARRQAAPSRMVLSLLRRGRLVPVPEPDTALRFLAAQGEDAATGRRAVVGTAEQVREGVEAVAEEYGADEVLLVTITHGHDVRRRSYELVAQAFGLAPPAAVPPARAVASAVG